MNLTMMQWAMIAVGAAVIYIMRGNKPAGTLLDHASGIPLTATLQTMQRAETIEEQRRREVDAAKTRILHEHQGAMEAKRYADDLATLQAPGSNPKP